MKKLVNKKIKELYKKYEECVIKWTNANELLKSQIDPTSLIVSQFFRKKTLEETINLEINRKIDKSVLNELGKFYENILNLIPGCFKPSKINIKNFKKSIYKGFDLVHKNETKKNIDVIAEIKNKHNTTNSSSAETIYLKMLKAIKVDSEVVCYLVEVISKKSRDINWIKKIDGKEYEDPRIRRISIDRFLEKISNKFTFKDLWNYIKDSLKEIQINNDSIEKLQNVYQDIDGKNDKEKMRKIIKKSFKNYIKFNNKENE